MEYLNKPIYGIIKLNSKMIYGINKHSIIREFISIYPKIQNKILVSTKKSFQTTNMMGMCKLDSFKNNIHYGSMCEYFGDLGNELNEETFIKRIASDGWKKIIYTISDETLIQTLDKNIYSIDPIGCVDIDDAIHIEEFDNYYQIGIHIADASYYIEENTLLDLEIQKRGESIYLPNKNVIHMLPENLMKICSLTQNKLSRVISIIFEMNKDTYKIYKYDIQRNIIKPINLSYEETDKLIKTKNNKDLELLYKIGQLLYPYKNENYDIHKMVEKYMILANN